MHDAISGREPSLALPIGIDDATFAATWRAMHRDVIVGGPLPSQLRNIAMSGWATVAGAHAIASTFTGEPERAIAAAGASGGDTDTIGSIVGARYALAALPLRWVEGLHSRDLIDSAIRACCTESALELRS